MSGFDPTFIASGSGHRGGSVPDPGSTAGSTKFLREDTSWAVPSGTGISGIDVSDGTTSVSAATSLLFSGATVSNPSGSEAEVTIIPTITHGSVVLGSNQACGAGGWTTLPSFSITPNAGSWMFWGTATIEAGSADATVYVRIYDGSTDRGSAAANLSASQAEALSVSSDAIELDGSTAVTLQIYVASSVASTALATNGAPSLSTLTHLRCIRVN